MKDRIESGGVAGPIGSPTPDQDEFREARLLEAARGVLQCADAVYQNADYAGLNIAQLRKALARYSKPETP